MKTHMKLPSGMTLCGSPFEDAAKSSCDCGKCQKSFDAIIEIIVDAALGVDVQDRAKWFAHRWYQDVPEPSRHVGLTRLRRTAANARADVLKQMEALTGKKLELGGEFLTPVIKPRVMTRSQRIIDRSEKEARSRTHH